MKKKKEIFKCFVLFVYSTFFLCFFSSFFCVLNIRRLGNFHSQRNKIDGQGRRGAELKVKKKKRRSLTSSSSLNLMQFIVYTI